MKKYCVMVSNPQFDHFKQLIYSLNHVLFLVSAWNDIFKCLKMWKTEVDYKQGAILGQKQLKIDKNK